MPEHRSLTASETHHHFSTHPHSLVRAHEDTTHIHIQSNTALISTNLVHELPERNFSVCFAATALSVVLNAFLADVGCRIVDCEFRVFADWLQSKQAHPFFSKHVPHLA